jgi:hypothetical protein
MNIQTNTHGGEEVAGTKFLTWAVLVVAAGLLFGMSVDLTSSAAPQTHTVQTIAHKAS